MTASNPLETVKAYSVSQVAEMLNMDARTVRNMAREGKLHAFTTAGRRMYITRTSLEKLLQD